MKTWGVYFVLYFPLMALVEAAKGHSITPGWDDPVLAALGATFMWWINKKERREGPRATWGVMRWVVPVCLAALVVSCVGVAASGDWRAAAVGGATFVLVGGAALLLWDPPPAP